MQDLPHAAAADEWQAPSRPLPFAWLAAAVDQFGGPPPTKTQSRRHGYQPDARGHVERFLLHTAFGVPVKSLAAAGGKSLSTVRASIRRGQQLVWDGAEAKGFTSPDGDRYERDPDAEHGYSNPDAGPLD